MGHRPNSGRLAATLLALCTAGASTFALAPADASLTSGIDRKVDKASDQLDDATREVSQAQARLRAVQDQLDEARGEVADADKAVHRAEAAYAAAAEALAIADAKVSKVQAEVDVLRDRIEQLKVAVAEYVRKIYTQGGDFSELEILLSAHEPGDYAALLAAMDAVSRDSNSTLHYLALTNEQLSKKLAELQQLEQEAQTKRNAAHESMLAAQQARREAAAAKARLADLADQRADALEQAKGDKAAIARRYDALRAEQARIAAAAAEAARLNRGGNDGDSGSGSGGGYVPGSGLMWPVPGAPMVQGVGPRIHPVYGYRSCHTGIDLGAGTGTPIHAADDGYVVSTESGGPYGNHTMISHGNGLTTMYAHQSSFAVSPGEHVRRGEVIGYVGTTGWVTGAHLHYEVHVNGTPYNPMGWYGGDRSPVRC